MVWAEEGHVDIVLCTGWLGLEYSRVLLLKTNKQKPAFLRTVLSGPVYYTGSVVQEALSPVWNCIFQSHYFWRVPFPCLIWDTCLWQHFWSLARFTDKASHRPETCGTKEPGCRVHGSHLSFRHRLARGALFPIHPGACKPVSARREQLQGFHSQSLKPWRGKRRKGSEPDAPRAKGWVVPEEELSVLISSVLTAEQPGVGSLLEALQTPNTCLPFSVGSGLLSRGWI